MKDLTTVFQLAEEQARTRDNGRRLAAVRRAAKLGIESKESEWLDTPHEYASDAYGDTYDYGPGLRLCLQPGLSLEVGANAVTQLRRITKNKRGKSRVPEYSGHLSSAEHLAAVLRRWGYT